jgi:hypothetical protein
MPSDLSFWLISVPLHDGDPSAVLNDVRKATGNTVSVGGWEMPDLKVSNGNQGGWRTRRRADMGPWTTRVITPLTRNIEHDTTRTFIPPPLASCLC